MPLAKVFRIFCKSAYTSSTYALASLSLNSGAVAIVVAGARALDDNPLNVNCLS